MKFKMRTIPEHPKYEAFNDGDILNSYTGNILKPYLHKSGYKMVSISLGKKSKLIKVHRLVASAWLGPAEGRHVNHINGIKTDNRVENLEYCTPKENIQHAWRIGLCKKPDEERRKKMSEIAKANLLGKIGKTNPAKKVIDTSNGIIYDTISEAAKSVGLSTTMLSMILRDKYTNKTTLKLYEQYKN